MLLKNKFTLEEKLKLLTGKNMWQSEDLDGKIPSITMTDGPHGVRKMKINAQGYYENIPSNAYPNAVNIANSWNENVAKEIAHLIAEDCIESQVDILLAPGVNIKRTPLCGRNFEYYSEDPILAGIMAKNYIQGLHDYGVGACIKHFCANNRETGRYFQSSEVSERALREIYIKAFEIALEAKPEAVMTSYNPINGVYASENKKVITDILKNQLGYKGLVISDWMGVKNSYKALKAGTDLRMPYDVRAFTELQTAYEKGLITNEEIDHAVIKILNTIHALSSLQKNNKVAKSKEKRISDSVPLAEESIVLLKNNKVLPLQGDSVCVIGELNSHPFIGGGGAAFVISQFSQPSLSSNLSKILQKEVPYSKNVYIDSLNPSHNDREGCLLASQHDVSIVIVGLGKEIEKEGYDRESMRLSKKDESLILSISDTGTKTIVIIEAGSAIDMSPWIDKVDAVIFAGYLGDATNYALANVLTGISNFSGKLSETFPYNIEDTFCKSEIGGQGVENYNEGILVGYRYYDTKNIPVRFPFGFGLSYSEFKYSDLMIEKTSETDFIVSFIVKNISNTIGKEISQLYIKDCVSTVLKPEKELKAFKKTEINANSSQKIIFKLSYNDFAHYDVINEKYYVENGEFIILIGNSSYNLPLKQKISIYLPLETQHSVY